eukprot:CAMPEP_0168560280 /NCGR_PEP_ID=MMETSP0413-20121227/10976_1 /TAXON_ID=136452 /ORGANISM="Filamoeba nolandi, Strain NC-AS-23-1" /LENGTH=214 /DNA_ID=CAMNT_0008591571 /DNA_START=11 /DNA_END=652 /DNA_ORIENTATION=-
MDNRQYKPQYKSNNHYKPTSSGSTQQSGPKYKQQSDFRINPKYKNLVVHCKKGHYDVYIGRKNPTVPESYEPDADKWGNPFKIDRDGDREECLAKYIDWVVKQDHIIQAAKRELKGKALGCWCAPQLCHGYVLATIANEEELDKFAQDTASTAAETVSESTPNPSNNNNHSQSTKPNTSQNTRQQDNFPALGSNNKPSEPQKQSAPPKSAPKSW